MLFDATFDEPAVAAEVPLVSRTRLARLRVGTAYDAGDEVAGGETAAVGRLHDTTERFVEEHETVMAGRWLAVPLFGDFDIRAADPDVQPFHQNLAVGFRWFGNVFDRCR